MHDKPRILGIDYGEKRIGVAVSDPSGTMALPLRVIDAQNEKTAFSEIHSICKETGATQIVVGVPINMNGTKGPMALKAEAFAKKLGDAVGIQVETSDERLSTSMVDRVLIEEADMSRQKRKHVRDKLAAQAILQGYLDRINGHC